MDAQVQAIPSPSKRRIPSNEAPKPCTAGAKAARGDTRRPSLSNSALAMRSWPHVGLSCAIWRMSACELHQESEAVQGAIASARAAGTPDDASGERFRVAQRAKAWPPIEPAPEPDQRRGAMALVARRGVTCDAPDTAGVVCAGRGFLPRVQDWGADRGTEIAPHHT